MSPRALTVLAMLAALVMAPSSVFAAGNELLSAAVSPSTGTSATLFELSVRYSSASNTANAVTATVAGKTVPLSLTSGSSLSGIWTGDTTLPAGLWTVTFQADASKGADPSLTIGPVVVNPVGTQPSSTPGSQPSTDGTDPGGGTTTAEPKPQASSEPSPTDVPAPASDAAKPSGNEAPAASATASSVRPRHGGAPQARSAVPRASSPSGGAAAPGQQTATAAPGSSDPQAVGRELAGVVLLFGIAGVAAIALLGAAWILVASRRDRDELAVAPAPAADPVTQAISTVERRALRRARLRPSNDPILEALGLNDDEASPIASGESDEGTTPRRSGRAARRPRSKR
jgi:hypothetical protein